MSHGLFNMQAGSQSVSQSVSQSQCSALSGPGKTVTNIRIHFQCELPIGCQELNLRNTINKNMNNLKRHNNQDSLLFKQFLEAKKNLIPKSRKAINLT